MLPANQGSGRSLIRRRCGVSLLELIVVITLLGIFAAAAATRFGRDVLGDAGVRGGARKMSLAILEAQRGAIRTGDQHALQLSGPASNVTSFSVVQILDDGSRVVVDGPHDIPSDYQVSASAGEVQFNFEGNGVSTFVVNLSGPHRTWQISVQPLTRMIDCQEVK